MSCKIVPHKQIDYILTSLIHFKKADPDSTIYFDDGLFFHSLSWQNEDIDEMFDSLEILNKVKEELMKENHSALFDSCNEVSNLSPYECVFRYDKLLENDSFEIIFAQVLKFINTYEYEAKKSKNWKNSNSKKYIESIRKMLCDKMIYHIEKTERISLKWFYSS